MENNEVKNEREQSENLNNETNNFIDMDALINNLKSEDSSNLRLTKTFKWLYILMIVPYIGMMIINPDPEFELTDRLSNLCFIVSFIIFAIIFWQSNKEYRLIDYSIPLAEMLKKAANRYKLSVKRLMVLLLPLIFMDAGLVLTFYFDLSSMSPVYRILIVQAFFIPIMFISALIGVLIWKKKQKPLRDKALELLKELEG